MTDFVIDASVAVKWLLPEVHADKALLLLEEGNTLLAPDFILAELGNVLLRKVRTGEIVESVAREMLADFRAFPLDLRAIDPLLEQAWGVAHRYGRSVYDSLYLALAMQCGSPMVTADRKLVSALRTTALKKHVVWIEDIG